MKFEDWEKLKWDMSEIQLCRAPMGKGDAGKEDSVAEGKRENVKVGSTLFPV